MVSINKCYACKELYKQGELITEMRDNKTGERNTIRSIQADENHQLNLCPKCARLFLLTYVQISRNNKNYQFNFSIDDAYNEVAAPYNLQPQRQEEMPTEMNNEVREEEANHEV